MIALRCRIRPGPFSGWKEWRHTPTVGETITGLVSTSHCYHADWRPVRPSEPATNEQISGLVEVTLEENYDPSQPDYALVGIQGDMGTIYPWVHKDFLVQRPEPSIDELLATRPGAR